MNRREFLQGALITTAVMASSKAFAEDYDENLIRLTNKDNPDVLEQKHVPGVEVPGSVRAGDLFDVKVKVGFVKDHPSTPEHWITMIKLFINGSEVAKSTFRTGGIAASEALFRVKLDRTATLEAIEHCNLHGTWISEPVKVKVL